MQKKCSILIKKIAEEQPDFLTIIGEVYEKISLEDAIVREIREKLEVHSSKEYLDKFKPAVYQYLDTTRLQVGYSQEPVKGVLAKERKIVFSSENWLIRMVGELLENRTGKIRQENILEKGMYNYFGIEEQKQLVRLRCQWKHNWLARGKEKDEIFIQQAETFDEGNFLLYFYVEEKKNCLVKKQSAFRNRVDAGLGQDSEVEQIGFWNVDSEEERLSLEEAEEWTAYLTECMKHTHIQNGDLLVKCLTGPVTYEEQMQEVSREYNQYAAFFTKVVEQFINASLPIIQDYIQIGYYFMGNGRDGEKKLLITNCTGEMLSRPDYKKRLMVYLESVNEKENQEDVICQAIIPGVSVLKGQRMSITRERFAGSKRDGKDEEEGIQLVTELADSLAQYGVQSFVSSKDGKLATFEELLKKGVAWFEKGFEQIPIGEESSFLSPCYPNFTVIPRQQACIPIAQRLDMEEDGQLLFQKENSYKARFDGLYVEAAYVAAGLFLTREEKDNLVTGIPREVVELPVKLEEDMEEHASGVTFTVTRESGKRNYMKICKERTQAYRKHLDMTVTEVKRQIIRRREMKA